MTRVSSVVLLRAAAAAFLFVFASFATPLASWAIEADPGWPRDIPLESGVVTVYQPQPEDLKGNVLTGRAATSYLRKGETEPIFGVFWFEGRLDVDRDSRTAQLSNVKITRVRFPEVTPEKEKAYIDVVEAEIPKWRHPISLDRLTASLAAAQEEAQSAEDLKNDPPTILFRESPSVLVVYDGEPTLREIPGTKLQRVVNTPYPVLFDPATKTYYLTNTTAWYAAPDPMGPWKVGATPPPEVVAAIPEEAKEQAAQDKAPLAGNQPPQVLTAKEPTELVWTSGPPQMKALGDDLLYMRNTESNVFVDVKSKAYFVLLSGRWYSAASLEGPWTFIKPTELPPSFSSIPPKSAKGVVRASVPGTEEAKDALMDAQIPQTAAIKRGVAEEVKVNYDGEPQFKAVEKTSLEYAVNTGQQVLKSGDKYYLCLEGVWYVSGTPTGPWSVSDVRPAGVDDIPASNPLYNTKYVYIYDSSAEVVHVGYTPSYTGAYPYQGTVVYGTGYYYSPWVGTYYYPWAWTWGWGAYYAPYYGWGYAGVGYGFAWGFAWGAAMSHWGYGGGCWHGGYYGGGNINIGNINIGNGGNINRPGGGQGGRPSAGQLPAGGNRYNKGQNANRVSTADRPGGGRASGTQPGVSNRANNVYAGKDGGVYRQQGGNWEQRGQGGWSGTGASAGTRDVQRGQGGASAGTMDRSRGGGNQASLNRDAAARSRGAAQTRNYSRGGGGYSRGGGGMRGGGGGRRR